MILDFVSRDEWEAKNMQNGRRSNSKNVVHVLLQHTSTENCYNFTDCKKFLQNYQVCCMCKYCHSISRCVILNFNVFQIEFIRKKR